MNKKFFCEHDWKVLSNKITESKFEHFSSIDGSQYLSRINGYMLERKSITILSCNNCGKVKKTCY